MAVSKSLINSLVRILRDVARTALREATSQQKRSSKASNAKLRQQPHQAQPEATSSYPGDYQGVPDITYAPSTDGVPDPGEIVWTWVPYEEDYSQGKDRPVLLIGRDGNWLLGLQVTSKDHDRDAQQEARAGRFWIDIGTGAWDAQRRPSEVRVNRILRIDPDGVRRIGAILDQSRFTAVANEVRAHY